MKTVFMLSLLISFNVLAAPTLKFTGYKFTNKKGVSGTFKKMDWTFSKKAKSTEDFLKAVALKIDTWSIDAGNAARNINITTSLFKNWGGRYIQAKAFKINSKKKILVMKMTVGENTQEIPFSYQLEKGKIVLKSAIDLIDLGFQTAFLKLSKTCKKLHTGKDGVAKTWSTVDLEVVLDNKFN